MRLRFNATIAIAAAGLYLAACGSDQAGGPAAGSSSGGSSASSSGASSSGASSSGASSSGASSSGSAASVVVGPCDLYQSGGTPCVAAHSTVRALYGAYRGALYQVRRASDGKTSDVGVLSAGGYADSAAQDAFCSGTTCTISILYDQSGQANHLTPAPEGGRATSPAQEANASALALNVGGHRVYGLYVDAGIGYRNNRTSGVATGNDPEGLYMVASGKHFNDACCFDYGNATTTTSDHGTGAMEAIYFGSSATWGHGSGTGPWVMVDLQNGLFAGGNGVNDGNASVQFDYVTAMVKGMPNRYAIKAGDAASGTLTTMYEGPRPSTAGYEPMRKQGAIVLGVGGDNSNLGVGTFFEGCLTAGYPPDATDAAVQANIVAAGYGRASP